MILSCMTLIMACWRSNKDWIASHRKAHVCYAVGSLVQVNCFGLNLIALEWQYIIKPSSFNQLRACLLVGLKVTC